MMRNFGLRMFPNVGAVWISAGSSSLRGKYSDKEGALSVEFESDNKALITTAVGATTELSYKVDGEVILKGLQGTVLLTRAKDVSLVGGPFGSELKKSGW